MNRFPSRMVRLLTFLTGMVLCSATFGDVPANLAPGNARYVMVLWEAGTPIPGGSGHMGNIVEPNLSAIGGSLLETKDNKRIIDLPTAHADDLRRHPSVAYLQRLWMGEPFEELYEPPYTSSSRSGIATESDPILTWGPKSYSYDGSGNITSIAGQSASDNYTYDTAGRLIEATVGGKTETFQYDSFGNLVEKGIVGANATAIPVEGGSNRLVGAEYDVAGNMTWHPDRKPYAFDSLNMLTSYKNGQRILYDANDERIGVIQGLSEARWWFRDFEHRVLREYKSNGTYLIWEQDYVYAEGQLVGGERAQWSIVDQDGNTTWFGGVRHHHLDHLGSVRLVTNGTGRSVSEHDYYAFGVTPTKAHQEQINWGNPHIDTMRYAGHQREFLGVPNAENTEYLDYMHARYYDPNWGRFLSVDPVLGDPVAPQSWNRYSYARNSPLVFTDPTGEFVDLSALSNDERNKLIAGLNDFTGNTYGVDPNTNYLVLQSVGQNSSATATAFVDGLIGSTSAYNVVATTKPGESWYNAGQNRIEIDFGAFDGANYNGIDPRSFNLGSTAIHEWKHQTTGLFDTPDGQRMTATPQDTSWTGPIVDAVNVMRAERGLATRAAYYSTPVRPPGFAGFFGIGQPRSALRFFDPQRGRVVQVIRNVP